MVQHIAVHCSQHLEDLSLGNMRLGKADADLPALIAACPKLQHLELELNRLSVSQLRRIDFAMATSSPELVVGVAQNLSPPITSRFRASFANLDVVYAGRRRRSVNCVPGEVFFQSTQTLRNRIQQSPISATFVPNTLSFLFDLDCAFGGGG